MTISIRVTREGGPPDKTARVMAVYPDTVSDVKDALIGELSDNGQSVTATLFDGQVVRVEEVKKVAV